MLLHAKYSHSKRQKLDSLKRQTHALSLANFQGEEKTLLTRPNVDLQNNGRSFLIRKMQRSDFGMYYVILTSYTYNS